MRYVPLGVVINLFCYWSSVGKGVHCTGSTELLRTLDMSYWRYRYLKKSPSALYFFSCINWWNGHSLMIYYPKQRSVFCENTGNTDSRLKLRGRVFTLELWRISFIQHLHDSNAVSQFYVPMHIGLRKLHMKIYDDNQLGFDPSKFSMTWQYLNDLIIDILR